MMAFPETPAVLQVFVFSGLSRMKQWYVYMVRCADNSLYTGIATDVDRRVAEHNSTGNLAAKYTRARQPVSLAYHETLESRSEASQREYRLKRLSKKAKEALIQEYNSTANS